jgi:serine/threonine protein kinase
MEVDEPDSTPGLSTELEWIREPLWEHTVNRDAAARQRDLAYADLVVLRRIGSDSANGQVYLCQTPTGTTVATKVFVPDVGSQELEIAMHLGRAARHNPDLPFLMTYGAGEMTPGARAALRARSLLPPRLDRDGAMYLISEVAGGDLVQIFTEARGANRNGTLSAWAATKMPLLFPNGVTSMAAWRKEVAFHAFCCVRKLHEMNIAHLDPHQGNLMILQSGKLVIHDFGTSKAKTPGRVTCDYGSLGAALGAWGLPASLRVEGFVDLCSQ